MKYIYRFKTSFGFGYTTLTGVFLATPEEVDAVVGKHISFGKLFTDWDSVNITLLAEDITMLTDDESFIEQAVAFGLVPSGLNPLNAEVLY